MVCRNYSSKLLVFISALFAIEKCVAFFSCMKVLKLLKIQKRLWKSKPGCLFCIFKTLGPKTLRDFSIAQIFLTEFSPLIILVCQYAITVAYGQLMW